MGGSSKELLHLEHNPPSTLESVLLVNKTDSQSEAKKPPPVGKLVTTPVPQTPVLGKVKDFLGLISEANKRLQQDAKDNSEKHDIEVLTGNESQVIEMDLMLGIADLHTPDAVTAAESAIAGSLPSVPLDASSDTESEDSSGDEGSEDEDSDDDKNKDVVPNDNNASSSAQCGTSKSKKRPKIVEMS